MKEKRFSIVTTTSWQNYHFVHREYDKERDECFQVKDKITLCGSLDTGSSEYKDKLTVLKSCFTENEILSYCIKLSNKKIICAQCIGYFFSDEQD